MFDKKLFMSHASNMLSEVTFRATPASKMRSKMVDRASPNNRPEYRSKPSLPTLQPFRRARKTKQPAVKTPPGRPPMFPGGLSGLKPKPSPAPKPRPGDYRRPAPAPKPRPDHRLPMPAPPFRGPYGVKPKPSPAPGINEPGGPRTLPGRPKFPGGRYPGIPGINEPGGPRTLPGRPKFPGGRYPGIPGINKPGSPIRTLPGRPKFPGGRYPGIPGINKPGGPRGAIRLGDLPGAKPPRRDFEYLRRPSTIKPEMKPKTPAQIRTMERIRDNKQARITPLKY